MAGLDGVPCGSLGTNDAAREGVGAGHADALSGHGEVEGDVRAHRFLSSRGLDSLPVRKQALQPQVTHSRLLIRRYNHRSLIAGC